MKKKCIWYSVSVVVLILTAMVVTYLPKKASSQKELSPVTAFVHGYKGTANSFAGMMSRFQHRGWGNKTLVCYVTDSGNVKTYSINNGTKKPQFIQVVFENNRASFSNSALWLSKAMKVLKIKYHIDSINLVGHSMGGLVSLKYVEDYQDPAQYPVTNKLIAIGSPFGGIYDEEYFQIHRDAGAHDLEPNSRALQLLQYNATSIPGNLQVFSIGSTGDPVAVPESVQELRNIVPDRQLTEELIENPNLGHSKLHENELVDQYIHTFLWQE